MIKNTVSVETIIQELDIKEEGDLRNILDNISDVKTDNSKYKVANALTRIHELKGSTQEFLKLTEHVKERSSKDYVQSKNKFDERLNKI